jgi:hypothetical protein
VSLCVSNNNNNNNNKNVEAVVVVVVCETEQQQTGPGGLPLAGISVGTSALQLGRARGVQGGPAATSN